MDCTGFSQQTPLLGEIVFSVIGGRYTGSVSQNKQLLYRGQSRGVRMEPAHMHITESKSNEDYTLLNNEDQGELLLIQYCAFIFHLFRSLSHLCVCHRFLVFHLLHDWIYRHSVEETLQAKKN